MDPKVNIEGISPIRKRIEVEVPAQRVDEEIERFLRQLNKQVRVRGFRPGKVPPSILKRRYKDYIEEEVSLKLIDDTYQKIVLEQEIRPVGNPQIEREGLKEGEAFRYSAIVDVRPQVEVSGYLGLRLRKREPETTPQMVEERLEALRDSEAKAKELEAPRGVGEGDLVLIDLKGEVEGEPRRKIERNDYTLLMGSSPFPPKFEDNLRGVMVGEMREFTVTYPEDHPEGALAGKEVRFQIQVKDIKEVVKPELNDDFAKDMGCENLEELKTQLRETLRQEEEAKIREAYKEEVKGLLLSQNSFEVPPSMIEAQVETKIEEIRSALGPREVEPDWVRLKGEMRGPAEREVRANLILEEIARREGLSLSEEEIEEEYLRIARRANRSPEEVKKIYMKNNLVEGMRRRLLIGKALEFVLERAEFCQEV